MTGVVDVVVGVGVGTGFDGVGSVVGDLGMSVAVATITSFAGNNRNPLWPARGFFAPLSRCSRPTLASLFCSLNANGFYELDKAG